MICRKIRFFMMLRRYYVALYTQSKFPKISILLHLIFLIIDHYNSHDKARKCIAVAEMIISLHKNNFTPFNLGLALQLYHGYGSKHLIETFHAFGMCASYTEVRQFLTSAANHEIAKTEVSCIPYGISHKTLGVTLFKKALTT